MAVHTYHDIEGVEPLAIHKDGLSVFAGGNDRHVCPVYTPHYHGPFPMFVIESTGFSHLVLQSVWPSYVPEQK